METDLKVLDELQHRLDLAQHSAELALDQRERLVLDLYDALFAERGLTPLERLDTVRAVLMRHHRLQAEWKTVGELMCKIDV